MKTMKICGHTVQVDSGRVVCSFDEKGQKRYPYRYLPKSCAWSLDQQSSPAAIRAALVRETVIFK